MNLDQSLALGIIGAMMGLFLWGRLRYDVVACLALLAAVAAGIVPAKEAFKGFADDIVIIVGSALVVSTAIARSGAMERVIGRLTPFARTPRSQVVVLVLSVTMLSAFIKNIGALAMMMPIAFQTARKSKVSPSMFLMPMAFGALLGGITTLVGTSPNIIVARVREEMTGVPFAMFDFTPVGVVIAAAGVVFLAFGYRLLPKDRRGAASLDQAIDIKDYVTEGRVVDGSPLVGQTLADLRRLADADVTVAAMMRGKTRATAPLPDAVLAADDIIIFRGDPTALEQLVARTGLQLEGEDRPIARAEPTETVGAVEAVVGPDSLLIGRSAGRVALHERYGVNLLAVSRRGQRFTERLRDIMLRAGDVVVLQGNETALPDNLRTLGLLPLAERSLQLGTGRRSRIAVATVAVTVLLVALGVVPVAVAFFAAAVVLVLLEAVPIRDAYAAIEWPILIMLGALIPVSDALRTTGTTDLLAQWLSTVGAALPGWGALALIMVAAMAVTPFLNNAATVLVMAPIAANFATALQYKPDAFLMAVAIGAACDFLTPIGHQCNTLVMGPGGYRFGDYARLGAPLSLIVVLVGVPLLLLVWPLR